MGLAEAAVKLVKLGLRKWAAAKGYHELDDWPEALDKIIMTINNRGRRGEPYTPSQLMLGRQIRHTDDVLLPNVPVTIKTKLYCI